MTESVQRPPRGLWSDEWPIFEKSTKNWRVFGLTTSTTLGERVIARDGGRDFNCTLSYSESKIRVE